MTYDEFLSCWNHALSDARLPLSGGFPKEHIDTRTLDREFRVFLFGPDRGARPFTVSVEFHFAWSVLTTARATADDEDVLFELIGRRPGRAARTEPPWIRVDTTLHAALPHGRSLPFPSESVWGDWSEKLLNRLESTDSLVPARTTRVRGSRTEVLAYQGLPKARCECNEQSQLVLDAVEIAAWNAITIPRTEDRRRARQAHPDKQLGAMFVRVRGALRAWMETLHLLLPPPPARSGRTIARA